MPSLRLLPELEDSLRHIPGVKAASVVTGPDAVPTEVHVLAAPGKAAKQVVRDVQSLALARFDVVLELVGAPNFPANLKALETGGRIVVIGVGGGSKLEEFNLLGLLGKRARIMGSTLRARPLEEKALVTRRVERRVLSLLQSGSVEVPVAETFPLDRVGEAYDHFEAGGKLGKVVLELG